MKPIIALLLLCGFAPHARADITSTQAVEMCKVGHEIAAEVLPSAGFEVTLEQAQQFGAECDELADESKPFYKDFYANLAKLTDEAALVQVCGFGAMNLPKRLKIEAIIKDVTSYGLLVLPLCKAAAGVKE